MSRNRALIALLGALASVVLLAAGAFAALATVFATCDGDGDYPPLERGSTAGRFCASPWSAWTLLAELALPMLVMLVLTVVAVIRRQLIALVVGAVLAVVGLITMAVGVTLLPRQCSDLEQQADPMSCSSS